MEKPSRHSRARKKLDMNQSSAGQDNQLSEATQKPYLLRDLVQKAYVNEDDDTTNEDFSPDESEYLPSPERRNINSVSLSPMSSLGGNNSFIEAIHSKISSTPSTVSNLSFCLNHIDFIASPGVIYISTEMCSTPTTKNCSKNHEVENRDFEILDITLKPSIEQRRVMFDTTLSCTNMEAKLSSLLSISTEPLLPAEFYIHTNSPPLPLSAPEENLPPETAVISPPLSLSAPEENLPSETAVTSPLLPVSAPEENLPIEAAVSSPPLPLSAPEENLPSETAVTTPPLPLSGPEENLPAKTAVTSSLLTLSALEDNLPAETAVISPPLSLSAPEENLPAEAAVSSPPLPSSAPKVYLPAEAAVSSPPLSLSAPEENLPVEAAVTSPPLPLSAIGKNLPAEALVILPPLLSSGTEPNSPAETVIISPSVLTSAAERNFPAERQAISPSILSSIAEPNLPANAQSFSSAAPSSKELRRKRKRDEENWNCNFNKKRKNSGLAYAGCHSKKEYTMKAMGPPCSCKKNCSEKIPPDQRKAIFDRFYKLGNHTYQWQFILKNTEVKNIKCMTLNRKCNRTQTINYYFNVNNEKIQVCKKFFLNTLSISDTVVFTALEKIEFNDCVIDHRGDHANRPHKIKPATEETVINHIKLFPLVESHYVRKDSKKSYLSQNLNIALMFRLYKAWFENQNCDAEMASERQYRTIFNTKFNISFFKPKKDLCSLCTCYEQADEDEKNLLAEKYEKHITNKNMVRDIKNREKENTDACQTIAIFDLEKVLSIPKSEVGEFHYKRKYSVYNLTVFDASRKVGYCFMWHQQIAKRGAIEIGSCLIKFLNNEHERGVKNISFYSDGCWGQNRNRFIFALYLYIAKKMEMNITHRFFEKGHSQNEGDSMHACIERHLKNKVVYTPDQMYALAMNAKVTGEKYIVKELEQSDFVNIKQLIEGKNWIYDTNGKKIAWSKIMEVSVSCTYPNKLMFKYDFSGDYLELNTTVPTNNSQRRGGRRGRGGSRRGRVGLSSQVSTSQGVTETLSELPRVYNQPLPISKVLHYDLMKLCEDNHIPRHYHAFYKNLIYEGDTVRTNDCDDDNNDSDDADSSFSY